MYSNRLYTPLRYPGGKARFAPFIAQLMADNNLHGGHYFEPYAGGAGVALDLLFHGHAGHIHINDLDPAVHAFWQAVKQYPEELLRLIADTPVTIDEWLKWRAILRGEVEDTLVRRGFATLFMNRTNRSGILKGGVIGGLRQDGAYLLDARFKKHVLSTRISKIAEHASSISVYCMDAVLLLKECSALIPQRSLIYLDPPYYNKGQGLYRNYYKHDDHLEIANTLQDVDFPRRWVVSYDNSPEICVMYSKSQSCQYDLNYTAQVRYRGNEVMFFSKELSFQAKLIPQPRSSDLAAKALTGNLFESTDILQPV